MYAIRSYYENTTCRGEKLMAAPSQKSRIKVKELTFQWEGKDKTGRIIKGEMRASGENIVKNMLRRQGISVIRVKRQRLRAGRKISDTDITMFTRQLATMMKSGVPLLTSFDT